MSMKDPGIFDLLEEYADIRDELEDTMQSFEILGSDIGLALDDIRDELETLQEHLDRCSNSLIRFRRASKYEQRTLNVPCEHPFGKHTEISIINDGNGVAEAIPELSGIMTEVKAMSCQQTIANE